MKNYLRLSMAILIVLTIIPVAFAAGIGTGIGGGIEVEEFKPMIWQCSSGIVTDDEVQPWRFSGETLFERSNNYLFDGERYRVDVLVFDKNKIEDVKVDLILEGNGEEFSINCVPSKTGNFTGCNARIGQERIAEFDEKTMQFYTCSITILDSERMSGNFWMNVEACDDEDQGGECGVYDEKGRWFINPVIEMGIEGELDFEDVRPGTASYETITIENEAEGGVLLDMFITGKNWPSANNNLGRCSESGRLVNYLPLSAFRYHAENGAFSTRNDLEKDNGYSSVIRDVDAEGYVNIQKQINAGFEEAMFEDAEIIQAGGPVKGTLGYRANVLNPGSSMALTFRLMLPEPCYGNFESEEDGSIFIWAEAI